MIDSMERSSARAKGRFWYAKIELLICVLKRHLKKYIQKNPKERR